MFPLQDSGKGIAASLAASVLFGAIYYFATLLAPLEAMEIFGWRMLITLPALSLLLKFTGFWPLVVRVAQTARTKPGFLLCLVLCSFLSGVQFWLFMWAPINGRAMQVSLGYLLMPLAMVLCGRVIYGEMLRPYQKLAVGLAAAGVANQVWQLGHVAPEALIVAVGFPVYFLLRRRIGTNHLGGLWFEILLMAPVAGYFVLFGGSGLETFSVRPGLAAMIALLGVLSAAAFACYIAASVLLPLGLFGLLSYVEPVLLVVVSLLLGERLSGQEIPTFACIGLGVAVLALGGAREHIRHGK